MIDKERNIHATAALIPDGETNFRLTSRKEK